MADIKDPKKDDSAKAPSKKDDIAKDPSKKDDIAKDSKKNDASAKDPSKKEDIAKDPTKKDDNAKAPSKDDNVSSTSSNVTVAQTLYTGGTATPVLSMGTESVLQQNQQLPPPEAQGQALLPPENNRGAIVNTLKDINFDTYTPPPGDYRAFKKYDFYQDLVKEFDKENDTEKKQQLLRNWQKAIAYELLRRHPWPPRTKTKAKLFASTGYYRGSEPPDIRKISNIDPRPPEERKNYDTRYKKTEKSPFSPGILKFVNEKDKSEVSDKQEKKERKSVTMKTEEPKRKSVTNKTEEPKTKSVTNKTEEKSNLPEDKTILRDNKTDNNKSVIDKSKEEKSKPQEIKNEKVKLIVVPVVPPSLIPQDKESLLKHKEEKPEPEVKVVPWKETEEYKAKHGTSKIVTKVEKELPPSAPEAKLIVAPVVPPSSTVNKESALKPKEEKPKEAKIETEESSKQPSGKEEPKDSKKPKNDKSKIGRSKSRTATADKELPPNESEDKESIKDKPKEEKSKERKKDEESSQPPSEDKKTNEDSKKPKRDPDNKSQTSSQSKRRPKE